MLLPHLAGRPLTRKRYPNGVDGAFFFEKNAPARHAGLGPHRAAAGARAARRTATRSTTSSSRTWPPWSGWPTWPRWSCTLHSGRSARAAACTAPTSSCSTSTRAPPAAIVECCQVALLLRERARGRRPHPGREDQRQQGPAGVRGGRPRPPSDARQRVRARAGREAGERAPGLVVSPDDEVAAAGQGAGRLEPEQRREDHGTRLLAAGPADRDRLDAGHLGRGGRPRPTARRCRSPRPTCSPGSTDGDLFEPLLATRPAGAARRPDRTGRSGYRPVARCGERLGRTAEQRSGRSECSGDGIVVEASPGRKVGDRRVPELPRSGTDCPPRRSRPPAPAPRAGGGEMRTVFVTGGSGFLGGALLDALCRARRDVRALARSEAAAATVAARGAVPVRGDCHRPRRADRRHARRRAGRARGRPAARRLGRAGRAAPGQRRRQPHASCRRPGRPACPGWC